MEIQSIGIETLHGRVEAWECDFNNHWNARFYGRSFQLAAEVIHSLSETDNPGSRFPARRHIRYHRELFVGAPFEVRSVAIAGGAHDGAIAHLLFSDGRLSATALDIPGIASAPLPRVDESQVLLALPRGLKGPMPAEWTVTAPGTQIVECGPTRPSEVDHTGELLFEEIIRRTAISSHLLLDRLGMTQEFTSQTGIGRMAVELRISKLGNCPVGTPLRVKGGLAATSSKALTVAFRLENHRGDPVAVAEHSIVTVDLKTRKAVELPDFLRQLAG